MNSSSTTPHAADHTNPQQQYVLGVDGGGTKTAVQLATFSRQQGHQVIGRGSAGSSNVRAVGMPTAEENLKLAIHAAWQQSGQAPQAVDAAVFALAGSGIAEIRQHFETWAQTQHIARQVRIVHDAEAVLAAGTPDCAGAALICGTGSVALARGDKSPPAVAGGWGYWFGDEGSAYWIGQCALRAVSKATDGRGPQTVLTQHVLERLSTDDPRAILAALSRDDTRHAIAGLAELVTAAAEQSDEVAANILDQAADELTLLVEAVCRKVNFSSAFSLALAGGVLLGSSLLRDRLCEKLAAQGLRPSKVELVAEPVEGCVRLAVREEWGESRK